MSKLNDLLIELCPEGVSYFDLGDIAEYGSVRIDASEVDASSYVGVENLLPDKQGKTTSSFVPSEGRLVRFEEGDVLIGNIRPYLKKYGWRIVLVAQMVMCLLFISQKSRLNQSTCIIASPLICFSTMILSFPKDQKCLAETKLS